MTGRRRCMKTTATIISVGMVTLWLSCWGKAETLQADQVTERIQKLYDATKDFQAAFTQTYTSQIFGKKKVSSGFVYIKKPGMMRWDYKKPKPKHFVANGKSLYIYDPDLEQVIVDRSFKSSSLSTAVTFLWGRGKLSEEFRISFAQENEKEQSNRYVLLLEPKKKAQFSKLTFVVDKQTYQVMETSVQDPGGNINHIVFSKVSRNIGIQKKVFDFDIPKGIEVIEAPRRAFRDGLQE